MNPRRRLPNRRPHEIIEFTLDGVNYVGGVARFADGALAELFFHSAGKPGSTAERLAHDAAVAASLALQNGVTADQLRHSLVKLSDGTAAGPLGVILALAADGCVP